MSKTRSTKLAISGPLLAEVVLKALGGADHYGLSAWYESLARGAVMRDLAVRPRKKSMADFNLYEQRILVLRDADALHEKPARGWIQKAQRLAAERGLLECSDKSWQRIQSRWLDEP
jgi:hypothetical protein